MSLEATLDHFIKEQEKGFKELREAQQKSTEELDKGFKETKEMFKETDNRFHKIETRWGKFVEAFFKPGTLKLFHEKNINVKRVHSRVETETEDGDKTEFDILLVNDDTVVAIEVKTTLTVFEVDKHINKRLKNFYDYFPEYKNKKLYGAVAYIDVNEKANKYAYRRGLFVLTLTGENLIRITNDDKFIPKDFGK